MNKGFRFWMSGCAAVISLALAGMGDGWADDDADLRSGRWLSSRFDMAQTVQRLQALAPEHGLTMMVRWVPRGGADRATGIADRPSGHLQIDRQPRLVLVFASLDGGTPVLMAHEQARPDLPLSLRLRTRSDGVVEVSLPSSWQVDAHRLPYELARDITELPGLVADALG